MLECAFRSCPPSKLTEKLPPEWRQAAARSNELSCCPCIWFLLRPPSFVHRYFFQSEPDRVDPDGSLKSIKA